MLCVVALSADAQTFTTLAQFDGTNGGYVGYNPLIQGEDGNFYGATSGYYVHFKFPGTVFKVAPSGTLTTVQSLRNSDPYAGVLQAADGNLYGTTVYAGSHGDGRIFGIVPDGTLSTLFSFTGHDGSNPEGQLIQTSSGTI